MKIKLFEIQSEYVDISNQIIENGGEATEQQEELLKINDRDFELKSRCYGFIILDNEASVNIVDEQIKRLQNIKLSLIKTSDKLRKIISDAMNIRQIEEIKTPLLKINFRKSESVEIENSEFIPMQYCTEKTTIAPDKTKIKEAIKKGEQVIGCSIKQNKNIQIK